MKTISRQELLRVTPGWALRILTHTTRAEKILLGVLLASLLISGLLSLIGLIQRWTVLLPQRGGIYREAAVGQPHSLNPILTSGSDINADIIHLVYSPLFKLDNELKLQPDLAESYEISADRRRYTVKLRPGVTWHDGQPFTADDVIFTIASIQTPDYNSPLASQFQGVTLSKVDDLTVAFTLKEPYTPFPVSLTTKIIPQHVWASIAPRNAALSEQNLKPVGTGPFKFSELTTRRQSGDITSIRLSRNDNYYGQPPYLDEIHFNFFTTHEEAAQALNTNQADGIGFVPLELFRQLQGNSGLTTHRLLLPQYFALFFNQEKNSFLGNAGLRNSLALAINREALVAEALQGQGKPLHLPIPHGLFGQRGDLADTFDPEAAKQNLDEAGWHDVDGDGIREKDNQRLHLKITTTDWPEYIRTAELIQQQWQAIGVETKIEHLGAGTIQQTVVGPRDYEVLLFGEILPADPDPYPFWHSTQAKAPGLNLSLFQDKAVDKLLEEARKAGSEQERIEKYHQFQGKIFDVNPAIVLYQPYYLFLTKDKVRGITVSQAALPAQRFSDISAWHVRTKRVSKKMIQ